MELNVVMLGTAAADVITRSTASGNFPRALAVAEQLRAFPETVTSLLQMGTIDILRRWAFHLSRQGKIDSALIVIEKAWAVDSSHIEVIADRASLCGMQISQLLGKGLYETAVEKCQTALQLFPDSQNLRDLRVAALWGHSYLYYKRGEWEASVAVLQKGRALEPGNAKFADVLALNYHQQAMEWIRQEKWRKALEVVRRGLQDCPDDKVLREDRDLIEKSMKDIKK